MVGVVGFFKCAVEVDDVQVLGTGIQPAHGNVGRVAGVVGLAIGIAFFEAHDLTVAQVYGREDGEV